MVVVLKLQVIGYIKDNMSLDYEIGDDFITRDITEEPRTGEVIAVSGSILTIDFSGVIDEIDFDTPPVSGEYMDPDDLKGPGPSGVI